MRVAVLGLGLVGGSVAQGLAAPHTVTGYDADDATADAARRSGLEVATSPQQAVQGADLVVLAAPVTANDALLGRLAPGTLVTDVGSTKAPLVQAWRASGAGPRLVPGHPMAGAESAGWGAARPDLFRGTRWVLCPGLTAPQDFAAVCRVVLALGAHVVPADAEEHDRAVARISHAPNLLAAVLAEAALHGDADTLAGSLAAGSFRDLTRVAASPPERTAEFCLANGAGTADVLAEVARQIASLAQALRAGDRAAVLAALAAGHRSRLAYEGRGDGTAYEVVVEGERWWEPLLALGRSGGVITDVEQEGGALRVTARGGTA